MRGIFYSIIAALVLQPVVSSAYTRADHLAWLKENQSAGAPQFAPGDTITIDNADVIRPFIPKEQQDSLIFDGMDMKIVAPDDLSPREDYIAATEQFAGQASIASDGALENYTAGRPFDPSTFTPGSNEDGWRLVWNYMFRWQHAGVSVADVQWGLGTPRLAHTKDTKS